MKLHANAVSPYVRKVLVLAIETGLRDRIEPVTRLHTPVKPDPDLTSDNPLGKIPCLVTDDGTALYDSRVICEYLDSLHAGPRMFPETGPERWAALRRQALGDGILDAGVLTRYETFVRPKERQWDAWIESHKLKFRRALDRLEGEASALAGTLDIGTITIGCALGYLDFRYADEGWRARCPQLGAWYDSFAQRPAMAETAPREVW